MAFENNIERQVKVGFKAIAEWLACERQEP